MDTSIITIGSNIIWDSITIFSEKAFHIIFLKPSAALLFNIYSAKTVNHPVLIQLHISTNPILSRALINCPIMPTLGFYPMNEKIALTQASTQYILDLAKSFQTFPVMPTKSKIILSYK